MTCPILISADKMRQLVAQRDALLAACERLEGAADAFAADQTSAVDKRCGNVQPISVAEGVELNEAIEAARAAIARAKGTA